MLLPACYDPGSLHSVCICDTVLSLLLLDNYNSNMDNNIEERLVEEVRRYEHLYIPFTSAYKDAQMAANSWREIAPSTVLAVNCFQHPQPLENHK